MEVSLSLYDEVKIAMARIKKNKAAVGLPAELFKAGGDMPIGFMANGQHAHRVEPQRGMS